MKRIERKIFISLAALTTGIVTVYPCYSAEPSTTESRQADDKIQSLLDDVENNLAPPKPTPPSQKNQPTGSPENQSRKTTDEQPQQPKVNSELKTIRSIQSKIQEYDHRIEILEAELSRVQANLQAYSSTDNQIQITAKPSDKDAIIIRGMTIKLNGKTIFDQREPSGLWMPSRSITVFQGPLQPGNHRLDVLAIASPQSKNPTIETTNKYRTTESTLNLLIPEGKSRKTFHLEITGDDQSNSGPVVKLSENDTP